MEQYPESYCLQLVDPTDHRIIFAMIVNIKRVHVGPHIMLSSFARLARMDPLRRRQHLTMNFMSKIQPFMESLGLDFGQGYTLASNKPSLHLQHTLLKPILKEPSLLDIFVVPTESQALAMSLRKLNQVETEYLWMVDLADWISRPVLSDLRRIMMLKEYLGTFVIGDFPSGAYAAASVWHSSNAVLCNDQSPKPDTYRSSFRLISNMFQSKSSSHDQRVMLIRALSNAAAVDNIRYMLCHVERSSMFNPLLRQKAVAMATEVLSRRIRSERMLELNDQYEVLPTWLDPRDFSALLYFTNVSDIVQSNL